MCCLKVPQYINPIETGGGGEVNMTPPFEKHTQLFEKYTLQRHVWLHFLKQTDSLACAIIFFYYK